MLHLLIKIFFKFTFITTIIGEQYNLSKVNELVKTKNIGQFELD